MSIQAQTLNLLHDLQQELGLTYLFISHDLGVVQHIADRILVLHDGRVAETGATSEVLGHPQDEYTKRLVQAASL